MGCARYRYIAGVNTPDSIINTTDTRALSHGFNVGLLDPHHTDGRVQDWNVTFEKEIMDNTVMRIGYVGNYGDRQQQEVHYNDATPDYIWDVTTHTPLPTGPSANVATRPYDQQAYGNITLYAPTGYGRYNGVQSTWSGGSARASDTRFSGTPGTHSSSTVTPTELRVSMRCRASTLTFPALFHQTSTRGTIS